MPCKLSFWHGPARCLPLIALFASSLVAQTAPPAPSTLPLLPYPRQLTAKSGSLELGAQTTIAVDSGSSDDLFAAGLLAEELRQIDNVRAGVSRGSSGPIVLARSDSATGKRLLQSANLTLPAAAGDEGYALIVTDRQAAVVAPAAAGIFYGVQTLRQLFHPAAKAGAQAAAVQIVDWPALRWRAVQVDMSRGAIPTLAAFKRDIALLAEMKVNLFVLYLENTFAYKSLPLANAPGGAIDAAEAAELVRFAQPYHVIVLPEQESFGHLHLALQEEQYQDLAELPYGDVLSPAVPASLDFISKMFAELAPAFPGPFFHIGADETAQLGQGRSQPMQQSKGAGALYLDYLKQIDDRLQPYHRKVLFWGDIAQGHPELLSQLPRDMIAVPWSYGPAPSYAKLIQPFTSAGLETWVAPGVSNWSRIYPNYNAAIPNIQVFVADGRRLGSTGLLNTTWMDDGESLFDYCWYGLGFGAAAGWEDQPDPARFAQAYDWTLYRADGHDFDDEVQQLTKIHQVLQTAIRTDGNDNLQWRDPFSVSGNQFYTRMEPSAHQVRLLAEDVIANLAAHRLQARRYPELLDPVDFAARRFDAVGQKAIYSTYIAKLYAGAQEHPEQRGLASGMLGRINSMNGLLQDMRDQTSMLRGMYRSLWLAGNTPYFLDNISIRYDRELDFWQDQTERFSYISSYFRSTQSLPPLIHPDLAPSDTSPAPPRPAGRRGGQ